MICGALFDLWGVLEPSGILILCFSQSKEDYKHCDTDCILLVKHLVNSQSLSQPPLTLLPAEFLKKIQQELESLPRNILSDRAKKELHGFHSHQLCKIIWCLGFHGPGNKTIIIYIFPISQNLIS